MPQVALSTYQLTVRLNTVQQFFRTSNFFKLHNVLAKGYYGIETLYQTKATGNSDSQNVIVETTENTSTQEFEIRR